ncbi:hypothetical protein DFH07DRAFT_770770 [Mycena maculata]|uniref:Uncharacterized protein n=1 Tax=Mycena maculata TaxID=230809 RepID=A0AAD7JF36_9AGAR|nr:hypothetical protein DFH07DRAFT_770770 [Mycena maculata]
MGIFLHLSHKALLSVLAVCFQWNTIIIKDPTLSIQMFKKSTKVYVEPGCHEQPDRGTADHLGMLLNSFNKDPKYLRFKLTVPQHSERSIAATWSRSHDNASVTTKLRSDPKWTPPEAIRLHPAIPEVLYILGNGLEDMCVFIADNHTLTITNNLTSIPMVTTVALQVSQSFTITVKNSKGVMLLNLFSRMVKEYMLWFDIHHVTC